MPSTGLGGYCTHVVPIHVGVTLKHFNKPIIFKKISSPFLLYFKRFIHFVLCVSMLSVHAPCECLVPAEVGGGHQIPWKSRVMNDYEPPYGWCESDSSFPPRNKCT